jgi:hypothetical protein
MRSYVFLLVAAAGIVCLYLFATGAGTEAPGSQALSLERALAPFEHMTPASRLLLGGAGVAFLLALALGSSSSRGSFLRPPSVAWGEAVQAAFLFDVVIVGAVLLFFFLAALGVYPREEPSFSVMGALYVVGVLEAALGTLLAITLFFLRKPIFLFTSTVVAHVAEVGLLSVLFFLGSTG